MTSIEWTEKTWNPIVGCSIVSPGCTNCYAMRMAARLESMAVSGGVDCNGYAVRGTSPTDHYIGLTKRVKGHPVWTGKLAQAPDHVQIQPLRRKKPTMWFVNSMSDLFHEDVPDEWIDRVFAVMALCPQHTFQVLTKRSARMRAYLSDADVTGRWMDTTEWKNEGAHWDREDVKVTADYLVVGEMRTLPNVWFGVSAERQQEADARIPDLLATPAAVRFVSAEPLLGLLDLSAYLTGHEVHGVDMTRDVGSKVGGATGWVPSLDWIIVGGESGPGARPMHPDWARSIRDQCQQAAVPFFFKQWGAWAPATIFEAKHYVRRKDGVHGMLGPHLYGDHLSAIVNVGKARAGRILDGREWNEMPGASKYDQSPTDPHHGGKVSA